MLTTMKWNKENYRKLVLCPWRVLSASYSGVYTSPFHWQMSIISGQQNVVCVCACVYMLCVCMCVCVCLSVTHSNDKIHITTLVFRMPKHHKSLTVYAGPVSKGPGLWQQQLWHPFHHCPATFEFFSCGTQFAFVKYFKGKPYQAVIEGMPKGPEGDSPRSSNGVFVYRPSTNHTPGSLLRQLREASWSPTSCIWKSESSQTSERSLPVPGPRRLHQCRPQASWP